MFYLWVGDNVRVHIPAIDRSKVDARALVCDVWTNRMVFTSWAQRRANWPSYTSGEEVIFNTVLSDFLDQAEPIVHACIVQEVEEDSVSQQPLLSESQTAFL